MELALIGAGNRGMTYAQYAHDRKGIKIVAVLEPDKGRRERASKLLQIPQEHCFEKQEDFFACGKLCDAVILASLDRDHYEEAKAALDVGYDLLLEKPISPDPAECLKLQEQALRLNRQIIVCHVLRYTHFYSKIKEILDSGSLGRLVSIDHSENIGNFHMAHSFVRGNWRNSGQSSPIIMQKSCHDCDLLVWFAQSRARTVSSFGSLSYFRRENAPEGSAERCLECPVAQDCRYDARKAYLPIAGEWPAEVVCPSDREEDLLEALKTGPYGRCVYKCDNDVCDHQVMIVEFENGVTATFHLSAFSNRNHRRMHIMCEHGEIYGDDEENVLEISRFASNASAEYTKQIIHPEKTGSGHGGGDAGLVDDFLRLAGKEESRSSIARSVESHLIACAAERSRLTGQTIQMQELRKELGEGGGMN